MSNEAVYRTAPATPGLLNIKNKHKSSSMNCKGVGSKKCSQNFDSYVDLMDHRRDQHYSGNKVCRYFTEGTFFI